MTDQLAQLARPFAQRYVNPPPAGKHGSNVAHDVVTQKLLAVLGPYNWSIKELIYDDGVVTGCIGMLYLCVDGEWVTVEEAGDVENPEQLKTNGARAKHASSDAIKRCAMRLGVGLHLWSGDQFFLYEYLKDRAVSGESSREQGQVSSADSQPDLSGPGPVPVASPVAAAYESGGPGPEPSLGVKARKSLVEVRKKWAALGLDPDNLRGSPAEMERQLEEAMAGAAAAREKERADLG